MKQYSLNIVILISFLSNIYSQKSNNIDSLYNLLNQTDNKEKLVGIYNKLSVEMLKVSSDSALFYAEKALQLSKILNYQKGVANSYLSMGRVSIVEGNFDKSVKYLMNSLKIFENENDSIGISKSYLKLGYTYYNINEFEKAQKYNMLSLKFLKSNDYANLQNTYNNIGLIYSSMDMPDSALYYYQRSITSSNNKNGRKNVLYELGNIANLYLNQGNYKKALKTYFEVKSMSEEHSDKNALSISYCNLSEVYFLMAEKEKAINKRRNYNKLSVSFADSALITAKEVNSLILINYAYEQLFQSYKGLNDYKNAFLYLDSFVNVKDSLFDMSKITELEKLENKYQTEKQQLEIESYEKTKNLNEAIIKKQDQIILFGIIAIVIILVLFIFLILSYRKKLKINKILNKKNKAILNQRSEIAAQRDKMSELAFELKKANKKKNKVNKRLNELNESITIQRKEIASQRDKLSVLAFELKKSNKTKNKFISVLAHDLKNPFQSILGFSELIKEQTLKGKYDNVNLYSEYIYNTAVNTYTLLENLLDWAKAQAGMMKYKPKNILLDDIIRESIYIIKNSADAKNINLEVFCEKSTEVFADKSMIATIIRNLVTNAIKFTERNGSVIISSEKNNKDVIITVKDSGIGIKEEKISKLFKADLNFSTTGTENEKGSGLGLSVCKDFITKNNGTIKVKSKPGEGSSFIITIPLAKQN